MTFRLGDRRSIRLSYEGGVNSVGDLDVTNVATTTNRVFGGGKDRTPILNGDRYKSGEVTRLRLIVGSIG